MIHVIRILTASTVPYQIATGIQINAAETTKNKMI